MRERIAAFDWARTPLGAREHWPAALRHAVELMLALPQPGYIGWGPTLVSLYNDAYVAVLGDKHPGALGRSYHDLWQEIDADYRAALDATLAGEAQLFVDEPMPLAGRGRDTSWFTFSWTPLRGDDGDVAGFLTVGVETTERVLAAQVLQEKEALVGTLAGAPAQAAWETGADGLVSVDSESWRAYTGQTVDEWLGWGWLDALDPDDREHAHRQWADAVAARSPVDAEFRLRRAGGGWRWTNVRAVPVFDAHGDVYKWVGLNIDVDVRRRADDALRESQARLARELDGMELLQALSSGLLDGDGGAALHQRVVDAAAALMQASGASLQRFDPATSSLELVAMRGFDAEACAYWQRVDVRGVSSCGDALRTGTRCIVDDTATRAALIGTSDVAHYMRCGVRAMQSTPLLARDGRPLGMLSTHWAGAHAPDDDELRRFDVLARMAADLLERDAAEQRLRRGEAHQAFRVGIADALRDLDDPLRIQAEATRMLAAHLGAQRVLFAQIEGDEVVVEHDHVDGLPSIVGRYPASGFGEAYPDIYGRGEMFMVDDVDADARLAPPDVEVFRQMGIAAFASGGIREDGRVAAILSVHVREPRAWTDDEAALVREVGERVWAAIKRARVERELRDSRGRLAAIFANAAVGLSEIDPDGRFIRVNDELCRLLGRTREAVLGSHVLDVTCLDDVAITLDTIARARQRRHRARGEALRAPRRQRGVGGELGDAVPRARRPAGQPARGHRRPQRAQGRRGRARGERDAAAPVQRGVRRRAVDPRRREPALGLPQSRLHPDLRRVPRGRARARRCRALGRPRAAGGPRACGRRDGPRARRRAGDVRIPDPPGRRWRRALDPRHRLPDPRCRRPRAAHRRHRPRRHRPQAHAGRAGPERAADAQPDRGHPAAGVARRTGRPLHLGEPAMVRLHRAAPRGGARSRLGGLRAPG